MIEESVFQAVSAVMAQRIPVLASSVIRIYSQELRGESCLMIGVSNARAVAPGVPFMRFDLSIGAAVLKTAKNSGSLLDSWTQQIRDSAPALAALVGPWTESDSGSGSGSSSAVPEIESIDAIFPSVDMQDEAGVDESDKYIMHRIPFTLYLTTI